MNPYEHFDEEYKNLHQAINSVSALFMETKDIYGVLHQVQRSLLSYTIKTDKTSQDLKDLIDVLKKFLDTTSDLVQSIEKSYHIISSLKTF